MDDTTTWKLIHKERAATADTLTTLTAAQWAQPSLCGGRSVRETAAHIVLGAEQTTPHFMARMAANGFRFNTMMNRDARRTGVLAPDELIARLRDRVTTTNKPPAPAMTMLGEVVVHSDDICRPLVCRTTRAPTCCSLAWRCTRTPASRLGPRSGSTGCVSSPPMSIGHTALAPR